MTYEGEIIVLDKSHYCL